eukprot:2164582-Amphidinium_carterae.1
METKVKPTQSLPQKNPSTMTGYASEDVTCRHIVQEIPVLQAIPKYACQHQRFYSCFSNGHRPPPRAFSVGTGESRKRQESGVD